MWHHRMNDGMYDGMYGGMYGGGFGFGFLHLLGNLFFLALLIGALMFFLRGTRFAGMRGNPWMGNFAGRDAALEIARTRLAKSEITPEQFEDLRKGLEAREAREREYRNKTGFSWRTDNALETVRMRFAKGEISSEEFEMIQRSLKD